MTVIPTSLPPDTMAALQAIPPPRYPLAAGEVRMHDNEHGRTIDRVTVLLDSPGPPAQWGGAHTPPLRVLLVPLGPVSLPGQEQDPVDYESLSARELARLAEAHRQAQREASAAQYRLKAPGCHHSYTGLGGCYTEIGLNDDRGDYGKPAGWCWWCWNRYEIAQLVAEVMALEDALRDCNNDRP